MSMSAITALRHRPWFRAILTCHPHEARAESSRALTSCGYWTRVHSLLPSSSLLSVYPPSPKYLFPSQASRILVVAEQWLSQLNFVSSSQKEPSFVYGLSRGLTLKSSLFSLHTDFPPLTADSCWFVWSPLCIWTSPAGHGSSSIRW